MKYEEEETVKTKSLHKTYEIFEFRYFFLEKLCTNFIVLDYTRNL